MSHADSVRPSSPAAQLMAVEVISELLVSSTPSKLGEALTSNLRELSGARTVMALIHRAEPESDTLLHASPPRRANLFTMDELSAFCQRSLPDGLLFSQDNLAADHPFRPLFQRAGVQSLVRYFLRASGELVGSLLLFDLPDLARAHETSQIVHLLSPPIALALKNSLAHSQIAQLALELEKRVDERTAELARNNEELRQSEERFRSAIENAPFPLMIHAEDGHVLALSRTWTEITGYTLAEIPTIAAWTRKAYGENAAPVVEEIRTLYSLEQSKAEGEYTIRCHDGTRRIWDFSSIPLGRLPDGHRLAMSMASDVTARKQVEEELVFSEKRYRAVLENTMEGFWLIDKEMRIVEVNDAYCQMTGYTRPELLSMRVSDVEIKEAEEQAATHLKRIEDLGKDRFESQHRCKDGSLIYVDVSIAALPDSGGSAAVFLHDITARKRAEQQVQELAYFDGLTKLPNRRLMMDRLSQALIYNARNKRNGALLFIDLDDFKTLNDTYGHAEGDLLLREVARRLTATVRLGDTVARLGGDEFVVILEALSENTQDAVDQVRKVSEKILENLSLPVFLTRQEYRATASVGAALFESAPDSLDDLLKRADIAMYQAKSAGRNRLCFFDPEAQAAAKAHAWMEEDLRQAIGRDELSLYYQPQLDHGLLVGVEALLRWEHPGRGMVLPGEFIPLAEETDLIVQLGAWVLGKACAQIASWARSPATSSMKIAVNVSARQFHQLEFVEQVVAALRRSGADPLNLTLELTESMLVKNVDTVIAKMNALKALGVNFSLDDFGTGYSSLTYLNRLPIDQLKIDRSFVRNLLTDINSGAIVETIVALGRTLGLSVIAEGVETDGQRRFLASLGCHAFQGFLFSRPLPIENLQAFISRIEAETEAEDSHSLSATTPPPASGLEQ